MNRLLLFFLFVFRLLQLDLIIRDKNLNVANPQDTSTHDLLQSLMRIEKKSLHDVNRLTSKILNIRNNFRFRSKNLVHIQTFNWLTINRCLSLSIKSIYRSMITLNYGVHCTIIRRMKAASN